MWLTSSLQVWRWSGRWWLAVGWEDPCAGFGPESQSLLAASTAYYQGLLDVLSFRSIELSIGNEEKEQLGGCGRVMKHERNHTRIRTTFCPPVTIAYVSARRPCSVPHTVHRRPLNPWRTDSSPAQHRLLPAATVRYRGAPASHVATVGFRLPAHVAAAALPSASSAASLRRQQQPPWRPAQSTNVVCATPFPLYLRSSAGRGPRRIHDNTNSN
jgi:hypothetical protein